MVHSLANCLTNDNLGRYQQALCTEQLAAQRNATLHDEELLQLWRKWWHAQRLLQHQIDLDRFPYGEEQFFCPPDIPAGSIKGTRT